MVYKRHLSIFAYVIHVLLISCYSLDITGFVEDASNAVVDEFKLIEGETSDVVNDVSNVVVDDFKLIERKTSDALKDASNVVVDEFQLAEKKASNAFRQVADAVVYELQQMQAKSYGCQCADYSCGCCAHLEFPKIHLNDTGCVNITYLAKDYGISFTVTIDNLTIYNETVSAHNPPPICFGAPYLEKYAELCVHFYDLDASRTKLHGCVDIEARLHKVVVGRYKVGCFNIGKSTLGLWKKYHRLLIEKIRSQQKNVD